MWYVSNTDGYRMGTNVLVLIHLPNAVLIHVLVLIRITNTVVITVLVLIHTYRYIDTNTSYVLIQAPLLIPLSIQA